MTTTTLTLELRELLLDDIALAQATDRFENRDIDDMTPLSDLHASEFALQLATTKDDETIIREWRQVFLPW